MSDTEITHDAKEVKNNFSEDIDYFDVDLNDIKDLDEINLVIHNLCEIYPEHSRLKEIYANEPSFDYLNDKTKIETFYAASFANKIDSKIVEFNENYKTTAREFAQILKDKSRFPSEKFHLIANHFPCIIAGLRDYAEYIPFEENLFDLVIIDEGSQVSIAQALPAILRSKRMLVLGDKQQFSNVKTTNSSKELNNSYMNGIMKEFYDEFGTNNSNIRAKIFDIHSSVLDFFESIANFEISLLKHFRGYPELISF